MRSDHTGQLNRPIRVLDRPQCHIIVYMYWIICYLNNMRKWQVDFATKPGFYVRETLWMRNFVKINPRENISEITAIKGLIRLPGSEGRMCAFIVNRAFVFVTFQYSNGPLFYIYSARTPHAIYNQASQAS